MDEDVAIAPEQESPPNEAARPRTLFGSSLPVMILIAILVAAVLAESVLIFRSNDTDRVRNEVLDTSRRFVTLLSTFNPTTIERNRSQVVSLAAGEFKRRYQEVTSPSFVATLRERQADQKGSVLRIAVADVEGDNATVLALVQVTTTNKDLKTPRVEDNLFELSLVKTSSGWRIDGVSILGILT